MEWAAGLFTSITVWHWFVLAGLLISLEIIMPSTWLLWPGLAAIVTGMILAVFPDIGWPVQVLIFSGLAVAATLFGRSLMGQAELTTGQNRLNRRADQYLGRQAIVAEPFVAGRGAILIDDTRWIALAADGANLTPGTRVVIVSADGALLQVKAAPEPAGQPPAPPA